MDAARDDVLAFLHFPLSTDTQKVLTADTKKSSLLGGIFPFVSTMGWVIAWGC
jgi:hypothetical protein